MLMTTNSTTTSNTTATTDPTAKPMLPQVLWAQRTDLVYVTVNVPDLKTTQEEGFKINLTTEALVLEGMTGTGQAYALTLPFYAKVLDTVRSVCLCYVA
jgi:hypothetical protein